MNAAADLQQAIFIALVGHDPLTDALGGQRIHDHAPTNAPFPYVTFARAAAFDWSTASEDGAEHEVTIHAWSKARGKREAFALAEMIRERLHDAALDLAGHSLVNLRCEAVDLAFIDDADAYRARLRFRAVTEPSD